MTLKGKRAIRQEVASLGTPEPDLADAWNFSRRKMRRLRQQGLIGFQRIGNRVYYTFQHQREFIARATYRPADSDESDSQSTAA